eukprot:1014950-Prymnesium_polylepis.1
MGAGAFVSRELAAPSFKTDGSPSVSDAFVNAPMPAMIPARTRHGERGQFVTCTASSAPPSAGARNAETPGRHAPGPPAGKPYVARGPARVFCNRGMTVIIFFCRSSPAAVTAASISVLFPWSAVNTSSIAFLASAQVGFGGVSTARQILCTKVAANCFKELAFSGLAAICGRAPSSSAACRMKEAG